MGFVGFWWFFWWDLEYKVVAKGKNHNKTLQVSMHLVTLVIMMNFGHFAPVKWVPCEHSVFHLENPDQYALETKYLAVSEELFFHSFLMYN